MAKGSGRFRNRKLGFKTRIAVEVGVVIEDDPLEELAVDAVEDDKGRKGPETGVDKDEEGEVHLQAVIASTAAAVSRAGDKGKAKQAYIPTRATATVEISDEEYYNLHKRGYTDPFSYIRFSDTVEDCVRSGCAASYTMDEDDEDWLEDFNARVAAQAAKGKQVATSAAAAGAEKEAKGLAPLSEDDFELVMEAFELGTDQKAPMAHVNLSLLPSLADFSDCFEDPLKPHLARLRPYASEVYPHWRERRVARKGKGIIPQLDYDESNENNPYVCFRRRELKTSRKTRRSDQQNLERLIRLRNDLYAAHALMVKVQERERMKLDAIQLERRVFDERCEMRELKRRLNEPDGDEELLISRREKKRRREEQQAGAFRVSLRKPDGASLSPAALVPPLEELHARKQRADALVKQIERDLAKKRQGDQHWDDWTDASYIAKPPPTPARFWRAVEPVPNSVPFSAAAGGRREALGFAPNYQPPLGRVRPSFRKRVGRGGRILIDRIGGGGKGGKGKGKGGEPSRKRQLLQLDGDRTDESDAEEEDDWLAQRRFERQRYDTDVALDFPFADEPVVIDDFALPYLLRRCGLLKPADVENLTVDSSYLDEAFRFAASDPDKSQPPPVVVGRPPPMQKLNMAPSQAAAAAAGASPQGPPPQLPTPQQQAAQQPNAAAYAQARMQIAQQAAMRQKQQQLAASIAAGGGAEGMRRTPSQSQQGSPVSMQPPPPPGQHQPNGTASSPVAQFQQQGSPASHLGANGLPLPHPASGLPVGSSPQASHLLPNLQALNGVGVGANGLPATSRLSAPPYSNNPALQAHLQAQAMAAAAAAAAGRPMSAGGGAPPGMGGMVGVHPPSRPTSAASHHSPHLAGQLALGPPPPPQAQHSGSPTLRAGGVPPGMNGTPPPNPAAAAALAAAAAAAKRSSPMAGVQLVPGHAAYALPPPGGMQGMQGPMQQLAAKQAHQQGYGGFVQG
ncbi:hypothetical protein JCM10213_003503 [Rhodosporidiobolus nylandii]